MPPKGSKRAAGAHPAPEPAPKKPKPARSTAGMRGSNLAEVLTAAANAAGSRRDKTAIAAALTASRRDELDKYATAVLWAWGQDHDGWNIPRTDSGDRETILSRLAGNPSTVMPSDPRFKGQPGIVEQTWREHMQPSKGTPFPTRAAELQAQPPEEDEEACPDASGAELEIDHPSTPQKAAGSTESLRIRQLEQQLAASRALASSVQQRACDHCLTAQMTTSDRFACTTCGLRADLPADHATNTHLREVFKARLSFASNSDAGSHSSSSGQSTARTPLLAKRDKEFERLAAEGPQLPRFQLTAPIAPADALKIGRQAFAATEFEVPSPSLIKYVQSGRMRKLGYAIPRMLGDANAMTDNADATFVLKDGRMSATDNSTAPPLRSMREFNSAFFRTIGPALTGQPAALADWFALAATLVALDERHDWPTAAAYLDQVLADRVHSERSYADYDPRMVDSAARSHAARSGAGAGGRQPQQNQTQASATGTD